jgi:hypothetical protein
VVTDEGRVNRCVDQLLWLQPSCLQFAAGVEVTASACCPVHFAAASCLNLGAGSQQGSATIPLASYALSGLLAACCLQVQAAVCWPGQPGDHRHNHQRAGGKGCQGCQGSCSQEVKTRLDSGPTQQGSKLAGARSSHHSQPPHRPALPQFGLQVHIGSSSSSLEL